MLWPKVGARLEEVSAVTVAVAFAEFTCTVIAVEVEPAKPALPE